MDPTPYFTAIGCNRDGRCLKWDHDTNLIAYAGSNLVAVYNTDKSINAVIATMRGHTQDISTLDFFPQNALEQYSWNLQRLQKKNKNAENTNNNNDLLISKVVSGCFGGKICIFDLYQANTNQYQSNKLNASIKPSDSNLPKNQGKFYSKLNSTITLPNTAILHAQVITINNFVILVVVTSTGGIHLYGQDINSDIIEQENASTNPEMTSKSPPGSKWVHLQDIYVPTNQLIQTTAFSIYPHPEEAVLLLALGGVDGTLTLLSTTTPFSWKTTTDLKSIDDVNQAQISPLFALLGSIKSHRDWIRDIAFSPVQYDPNSDKLTKILLATASQDKTIRILSIHVPPKIVSDTMKKNMEKKENGDGDEKINDEQKLAVDLLQSSSLGENGHLWSVSPTLSQQKSLFLAVSLETVLFGHENWVMSLEFYEQGADKDFKLNLLSVSTDRTIIEWVQQSYKTDVLAHRGDNGSNSLWIPVDKIGEGLGYLCYYGGCYGPGSNSVVAVAYNGSLSLWNRFDGSQFTDDDEIPRQAIGPSGIVKPWYPVHCPTGHNKPVLDVMISTGDDTNSANYMSSLKSATKSSSTTLTSSEWSGPELPYILTLSQDQTTRAYAPFVTNKISVETIAKQDSPSSSPQTTHKRPTMTNYPWYELARAQIHGWDLCSLTHTNLITNKTNNKVHHHEFFSAGEEKVLRLFRAPALFIAQLYAMTSDIEYSTDNYQELIRILVENNTSTDINNTTTFPSTSIVRPLCAVQPKLGLSNKPLLLGDEVATGTELETNFGDKDQAQLLSIDMLLDSLPTITTPQKHSLISPPFEEQLATTTLWSEVDKLYGHGYDISTLTSTQSLSTQPFQPTINFTTFQSPQIFSVNHARKAKNAGIRQWSMASGDLFGGDNGNEYWQESDVLYSHQQTISTMKPTLDNFYLLTVGRDMQVTVFGCGNKDELDGKEAVEAALSDAIAGDNNNANNTTTPKVTFKPLAIQASAHTRQIFNCSWVFDSVMTGGDGNSTLKYFTTCARDKTIKLWAFNPLAASKPATKAISLVQTLKTPFVPTALHSVLVLDNIPANGEVVDGSVVQQCTNYLFVGFESGDLAVYTATIPVNLVPVEHQYDKNDILPYSIVMDSLEANPIAFTPCTTFDASIAHNAVVNQIITFPNTIKNSAPGQAKLTHLYEKNDHLVIVTASNDHSVKMFGVDL